MARPRKPTRLLELKGAFKKDPARGRARGREPVPSGPLGDPPAHFDRKHKACWLEIQHIAPDGVLAISDRFIVEIAVDLMVEFRSKEGLGTGLLTVLVSCLGKMGLNPADRSKLGIAAEGPGNNPFDQIAGGLGRAKPN
jgi:hypothetical protein